MRNYVSAFLACSFVSARLSAEVKGRQLAECARLASRRGVRLPSPLLNFVAGWKWRLR
jgi:hypothetical protein